jgi:hypothetical protein
MTHVVADLVLLLLTDDMIMLVETTLYPANTHKIIEKVLKVFTTMPKMVSSSSFLFHR